MNNQCKSGEKTSIRSTFGYFLLFIGYFTFKMLIKESVVSKTKDVYKG